MTVFQLLKDRRFYAVLFQSPIFLSKEQLAEMSAFIPAGIKVRMYLQEVIQNIRKLHVDYCLFIIDGAQQAHGKQFDVCPGVPSHLKNFVSKQAPLTTENIGEYFSNLHSAEFLADKIRITDHKQMFAYRKGRIEIFKSLRDEILHGHDALTIGIACSRSSTPKQRRRQGFSFLAHHAKSNSNIKQVTQS